MKSGVNEVSGPEKGPKTDQNITYQKISPCLRVTEVKNASRVSEALHKSFPVLPFFPNDSGAPLTAILQKISFI